MFDSGWVSVRLLIISSVRKVYGMKLCTELLLILAKMTAHWYSDYVHVFDVLYFCDYCALSILNNFIIEIIYSYGKKIKKPLGNSQLDGFSGVIRYGFE